MQQQRAIFLYCLFTQQRKRIARGSYARCGSEDEELLRLCDRESRETRTSKG
jgi:hypothetical protein